MEHLLVTGGYQYLPFARSRIKALRAAGLPYAAQRFVLPDATVAVRVSGDHEYIEISGAINLYSVGIESNRIVVRHKTTDSNGDWRIHSTFADAYSDPLDIVPAAKINNNRCIALSPRTTDVPGADGSDPSFKFVDGFGKNKLFDGVVAPYLAGLFWGGLPAWVISTDGENNAYLLSAVATDDPVLGAGGSGQYQDVIWKCEKFTFSAPALSAKPTMWAFTYDPSTHSDYGLHTLMTENVVYVGEGRFVYGLGGSSEASGVRDSDHKMVIIVTQDFETFTAYDVEAGLGGVFGSDDFALGGCCYVGNGRVLFGGYGTDNLILFDSADGSMTLVSTSDVGWSTSKAVPMPMGDDSACYFRYVASGDAHPSDLEFVYTTNAGVSWTAKPMLFTNPDGSIPTVDNYFGTTTVRKPLKKDGSTIVSNGELMAILHVSGVGHVEFRTKDLGTTWRSNGVVSPVAADPAGIGMTFRHILVADPGLSLNWG